MLNNPLKVLTPKMDNAIGTDDELHCIRYSLVVTVPRLPRSYRLLFASRRSHQRALVEAWFIGVNEKGTPCTKAFLFVQVHPCPVSVL